MPDTESRVQSFGREIFSRLDRSGPVFLTRSWWERQLMGLSMGNLNALAMEPVGHIAGLAASVTSALATVGSVLLAVPVGLAFNGTVLPLMIGVFIYTGLSWGLARKL